MLCGWISVPVLLCAVLWTGKPVRSASIEARETSDVLAAFKRAVLEKKAHEIRLFDRESDSNANVRSITRDSREQSGLLKALREAVVEKKNLEIESDLEALCIAGNSNLVCSGHGTCIEGKCDCNPVSMFNTMKKYKGAFCECNDYSCSSRGICICGQCQCKAGWSGAGCAYPAIDRKKKNTKLEGRDYFDAIGIGKTKRTNGKEIESDLEALCIAKNSNLVCSGHGTCIEGDCTCNPNYHGLFCQCSDDNCDYSDGQICGGFSRGICICGKCECKAGWLGAGCAYPAIDREDKELTMKDRDYFDAIGIGQNSYGNSYPSDHEYSWNSDEDVHGYPVAPANLWDDNESDAVYDDEYSGFK